METHLSTEELVSNLPDNVKIKIIELFLHKTIMMSNPANWELEYDWGTNIIDKDSKKEIFHCLREDMADFLMEFVPKYASASNKEFEEIMKEINDDRN